MGPPQPWSSSIRPRLGHGDGAARHRARACLGSMAWPAGWHRLRHAASKGGPANLGPPPSPSDWASLATAVDDASHQILLVAPDDPAHLSEEVDGFGSACGGRCATWRNLALIGGRREQGQPTHKQDSIPFADRQSPAAWRTALREEWTQPEWPGLLSGGGAVSTEGVAPAVLVPGRHKQSHQGDGDQSQNDAAEEGFNHGESPQGA